MAPYRVQRSRSAFLCQSKMKDNGSNRCTDHFQDIYVSLPYFTDTCYGTYIGRFGCEVMTMGGPFRSPVHEIYKKKTSCKMYSPF